MEDLWASNPSIEQTGLGNWLSNNAHEKVVYKEYWVGRTYYYYGFFDDAIPHFRKATKGPVPDVHSNDDIYRRDRLLLGRSWGHLGSIYGLSSDIKETIGDTEIPMQNDWESIECYRKEATVFNFPGSMFIYGKALVYGTGGVPRNVPAGLNYLNKAGAEKIGEAYLVLGSFMS